MGPRTRRQDLCTTGWVQSYMISPVSVIHQRWDRYTYRFEMMLCCKISVRRIYSCRNETGWITSESETVRVWKFSWEKNTEWQFMFRVEALSWKFFITIPSRRFPMNRSIRKQQRFIIVTRRIWEVCIWRLYDDIYGISQDGEIFKTFILNFICREDSTDFSTVDTARSKCERNEHIFSFLCLHTRSLSSVTTL